MLLKHGAINYGDIHTGNSLTVSADQIDETLKSGGAIYGVFSSRENLMGFLRDLVEADLGLSVVVQGLLDDVSDCCHELGLKIHTTNHSLGVWGRTDKLPHPEVRKIATMCGHGMVPASLVKSVLHDIKEGRTSVKQGALTLARPCICGIFNQDRAERLLSALIEQE
jgi:hypothetical protein